MLTIWYAKMAPAWSVMYTQCGERGWATPRKAEASERQIVCR
jgi:hypothetical protein